MKFSFKKKNASNSNNKDVPKNSKVQPSNTIAVSGNNNTKVDNKIAIPHKDKETDIQIIEKESDESDTLDLNEDRCHFCKKTIDEGEWKKPHWKWNLDNKEKICLECYKKQEEKFEKLLNYCSICESKLKFIRYNPKPEWKLKGQLCRKCWDLEDYKFKNK